MPKVNKQIVQSIPISIPSLSEQHRIVAMVESLMVTCDKLQSQLKKARSIAENLAKAVVEEITGISVEKKEKMKAPKTELVSKLRLVKKPTKKQNAPLSAHLAKHNDELSAKALYGYSKLSIDDFYRQLKTEMASGWIEEPEKAVVKIVEEKSSEA